jgi:hypothetical protein
MAGVRERMDLLLDCNVAPFWKEDMQAGQSNAESNTPAIHDVKG